MRVFLPWLGTTVIGVLVGRENRPRERTRAFASPAACHLTGRYRKSLPLPGRPPSRNAKRPEQL